MVYEPSKEKLPRPDLEQLQIERLQATLRRARQNVGFYRSALAPEKVDIEAVRGLEDLEGLPFTTREDLRKEYPYGMFAVPLHDVVRIHSSSGTSGKPLVTGYTRNDLQVWTGLMARVLSAAGLDHRDFAQIAFHYGQSTAGMGFNQGAERIGASVIPSSGEGAARQIMMMRDYRTTALMCTPSYALHLSHVLDELGIGAAELALRVGIFGAEPWGEGMRAEIERRLGVQAFDIYGLAELLGPGIAFECEERSGLHVNEDHFIMEVVDPATLKPLPPGERGELVLTSLTREACPLIRYRTGDLTRAVAAPCACGRTSVRMERISGRTDDMIIVDGINVFPSRVEEAILGVEGLRPAFRILADRRPDGTDSLTVQVEASPDFPYLDELGRVEGLKRTLERRLAEDLGVPLSVSLVEPKSLGEPDGKKQKRVIDRRGA